MLSKMIASPFDTSEMLLELLVHPLKCVRIKKGFVPRSRKEKGRLFSFFPVLLGK